MTTTAPETHFSGADVLGAAKAQDLLVGEGEDAPPQPDGRAVVDGPNQGQ